jgi:predicted N-acyltransferase
MDRMSDVSPEEWNKVAGDCRCIDGDNPFLSWEFLNALEESKSAHTVTGWSPQHVVARDATSGEILGCVPLYLKSHSYGEYVFDHRCPS